MARYIEVVGAVIVRNGLAFCAKRAPHGRLAGLWEFPGGKVEAGEDEAIALAREIEEELQCGVAVGEKVTATVHEYDFGVVRLTTFFCELIDDDPIVAEHADGLWAGPDQLASLTWAPADLPAVELVISRLAGATRG